MGYKGPGYHTVAEMRNQPTKNDERYRKDMQRRDRLSKTTSLATTWVAGIASNPRIPSDVSTKKSAKH